MVASFRKIDYSLRPAKYAERRMLCDIFRKLAAFGPVEDYQYIGFGSVWFSDFTLFHRTLSIKNMLSIEKSANAKKRIEANKPFWISMDFRSSADVLPELDYNKRQFIWLDYDDTIDESKLSDVAMIAARAKSGTVLAISIQCSQPPEIAQTKREKETDPHTISASERFAQRLGSKRVSTEIGDDDLRGWPFGELSRSVFLEEIREAVELRRVMNTSDEIRYHVICNFTYEDGAQMTTLSVVFYSPDEEKELEKCRFQDLDFLKAGESTVHIPVPLLTPKEVQMLERQLPLDASRELELDFIPPKEANNFANMYRYFPNFIVAES